jgi:hypothetical protein
MPTSRSSAHPYRLSSLCSDRSLLDSWVLHSAHLNQGLVVNIQPRGNHGSPNHSATEGMNCTVLVNQVYIQVVNWSWPTMLEQTIGQSTRVQTYARTMRAAKTAVMGPQSSRRVSRLLSLESSLCRLNLEYLTTIRFSYSVHMQIDISRLTITYCNASSSLSQSFADLDLSLITKSSVFMIATIHDQERLNSIWKTCWPGLISLRRVVGRRGIGQGISEYKVGVKLGLTS